MIYFGNFFYVDISEFSFFDISEQTKNHKVQGGNDPDERQKSFQA
jgi:hypothetical protein